MDRPVSVREPLGGQQAADLGRELPVIFHAPADNAPRLAEFRDQLPARLLTNGAVLFRGWDIADRERFAATLAALGLTPIAYTERTTKRRALGEQIYTSTEHPARSAILPHNENSYASAWPEILAFACARSALEGGETSLYDGRKVLKAIDPQVIMQLETREILHVRNFGTGLGLSAEEAFGVTGRAAIEDRLRSLGYHWQWSDSGDLQTYRTMRPVLVHPASNERCFFSHVAFFHQSALPTEVREAMLELYGERGLPHAMFFGDGEAISDDVIEHILDAYQQCEQRIEWQRGDLLVADNMLVAHGRKPFAGDRLILAAFSGNVNRNEVRFD